MFRSNDLARWVLLCPALVVLMLVAVQTAAYCQNESAVKASKPPANSSPHDLLIVELAPNADRDEFDQLLQEVSGKVINTMSAGPSLKFLVVQSEPGKVAEI